MGTIIKVLVSDRNFSLGKNDEVNLTVPPQSGAQGPTIKSHKTNSLAQKPNFSYGVAHKKQESQPVTHNDERVALILFWQVVLQYGIFFNELVITILGNGTSQNHIQLLTFDELVIMISAESGFQFNHASIINEVLNLINL